MVYSQVVYLKMVKQKNVHFFFFQQINENMGLTDSYGNKNPIQTNKINILAQCAEQTEYQVLGCSFNLYL